MPIYDQGYQRWNGEISRHPVRWWPIVRHGVFSIFRHRKYLILLLAAWIQPIVRAVQLFTNRSSRGALNQIGEQLQLPALRGMFADGMDFYFSVVEWQGLSVMAFLVFVGSDLIAQDRRFNALQIYFSKPLTLHDYLLGKLGILGAFLLFIVWLPLMLLWLFALSLSLRADYFQDVWALPLVATAYCALMLAVMGSLILALSSIGQRAIIIGVSFILLFGYGPLQIVTELLKGLSGNDYWGLLRSAGNLSHVGAWWFSANPSDDYSPLLSLIALGTLVAICYGVLRRRVRPVEIVL